MIAALLEFIYRVTIFLAISLFVFCFLIEFAALWQWVN